MVRQQKVRDALMNVVDVLAVAANELAFCYLRLGWSATEPENENGYGVRTSSKSLWRSFRTCSSSGTSSVGSGFWAGRFVKPSCIVHLALIRILGHLSGSSSSSSSTQPHKRKLGDKPQQQ